MGGTAAEVARAARQASYEMAASPAEKRNEALRILARLLGEKKEGIFAANRQDLERSASEGLAAPALARLRFDGHKLEDVSRGVAALSEMADPVGQVQIHRELADGLVLRRVSCPIGVVGVIFESRPDALIQIGSLCLKSGNCVLLKGGSEAAGTNRALFEVLTEAGRQAGLPDGWAALLKTREDVTDLLAMDEDVDLLIPRGSGAFVRYIMDHTRIPVLGHSEGVCHLYLDAGCDPETAAHLAVDAKTQYVSACNTIETMLWHREAAPALEASASALHRAGVKLLADEATQQVLMAAEIPCEAAEEKDWRTEYLALTLSIRRVQSLQEAISHINRYGSHHTDAIVTESEEAWQRFAALVDSAGVYRNCSTRFADGYRYGFGAEVGIATGRLHARGPMGLEGLCSYKYLLEGHGDTVAEFAEGKRSFTHRDLR